MMQFRGTDQNMVVNKEHYRHLMLFFFRMGKNATQAANKICAVYGDDPVAERTVHQELPGRPSTTDEDMVRSEIENSTCSTLRQLAGMLNKSKSAILDHTVNLGYVNRLDVWVQHNLTKKNLLDLVSICDLLYKRNEETPFLKQLVTGNEIWVIHKNVQRRRSWRKRDETILATPKAGLHSMKVMLCIWWDWKGILHYEPLPNNEAIDSAKYCSQLDKLKTSIDQKRPEIANRKGVVIHQDNARAMCL
ncbi:histone-lysine N-methyltransferase SETMAR-like [Lasioglossum baleicum]|uniref:histone-lysine N-methyltransferase SETMAR-like n=1 Tax=Lasioglossum baleicum TaxID=434251 RepID=UPI003FCDD6FC